MFLEMRGGVAARRAALLALLCIGIGFAGCRRSPVHLSRRYVRLETLLPLHPAWGQMEALERVNKAESIGQIQTDLATALPQSAPFQAAETLPANLERERRSRIAEDAQKRLTRRREDLSRHNEEVAHAEERAGQKDLVARIASAKAAQETALRRQLGAISGEYDPRITSLGYQEVAFLSQTRVYTGQTLADAQMQLNAVRAERKRLRAERDARVAQAQAQAESDEADQIAQWTRELKANQAKRRQELEALANHQMEREEASLRAEAEPIPGLASVSSVRYRPKIASPAPPDAPAARAQAEAAQTRVKASLERQRATLAQQKARLLTALREDTRQAVTQIARQQGWQLVPEGAPNAEDFTEGAAAALRAQWKR